MTPSESEKALDTRGVGASRVGDHFFLGFGLFLLLITGVGFSQTFFLASVFDAPELPLYLKIHGGIFSSWVLLFVLQASLIETSRVRVHMWIGRLTAVLAIGMVASGLVVLHGVIRGSEDLAADLPRAGPTVWGNLAILTGFLSFVGLGLYFRNRAQAHKRFMLLATLSMMGQPLVRIGQIPAIRVSEVRGCKRRDLRHRWSRRLGGSHDRVRPLEARKAPPGFRRWRTGLPWRPHHRRSLDPELLLRQNDRFVVRLRSWLHNVRSDPGWMFRRVGDRWGPVPRRDTLLAPYVEFVKSESVEQRTDEGVVVSWVVRERGGRPVPRLTARVL